MRKQLHRYQSSTLEDKWEIGFTIDINFVTTMPTFNDVKQHHQSLVMSRVAFHNSKLLTFFVVTVAFKQADKLSEVPWN